jgi:RNA polymerase subunit RPABC4/transcription elongation factor Spt4
VYRKVFTFFVTAALLFVGCSEKKVLTEEMAISTVYTLLAKGKELPDNCCPPASLAEWRGLVVISDAERQGKAVINHKDGRMSGAFIFHKTSTGEWVLDKAEFGLGSLYSWKVDVFLKVKDTSNPKEHSGQDMIKFLKSKGAKHGKDL